MPPMPGAELVHHYGQVRPAESYAGKRVFIIGKQNSGFELASGLLPWASQLVLASPSPTSLSVTTRTLVGRPRAVPAAVRGRGPGWRRDHPRCRHRPRRAGGGRRPDGARATHRPGCLDGLHGRRGHRRDRVHGARSRTCPHSAVRWRARAGCRSRRPGGRASRCPACSSRAPSPRGTRASDGTACRPTRARSMARATTPRCWRATSRRHASASHAGAPGGVARRGHRPDRPGADRVAGPVPPAGIPRPAADRRWIGRPARRRHRAPGRTRSTRAGPTRSR